MYVSVNGDDNGNGAKENPFATVQKAKEFVRTLDKSKGDITVEIGEGTYELDETISFDVRDSGTDKCRIRYVAADNGKVILSGGKKITGEWDETAKSVIENSGIKQDYIKNIPDEILNEKSLLIASIPTYKRR